MYTERQIDVLTALGHCETPARASAIAEAYKPGSDPRGVAQCLRHLVRPGLVIKTDGGWSLTNAGCELANEDLRPA